MLNSDYKDILQHLRRHDVKFLVVGAYAMGAHGYPRATGDFDLWVEATPSNAQRVYDALQAFGAPLSQLTSATFAQPGVVFQIGVPPCRIDLLTQIDGVEFSRAYAARHEIELDGVRIPLLSKNDLIKNKESTDRPKDRLDVEQLRRDP